MRLRNHAESRAAGPLAAPEVRSGASSRFPAFRPLAEGAAALAIALLSTGCASTQESGPREFAPPRGRIALYSIEDGIRPERVAIGDELNVLIRADVRIVRDGVMRDLGSHERIYGEGGLTYCWFVFQGTPDGLDGKPGYLLLNPRYREAGQPRYIGGIREFSGRGGERAGIVLPVRHYPGYGDEAGWVLPRITASREGYLFYLEGDTFFPRLDGHAILRLPDLCKETVLPEYAVVEFGPTFPVLAVYPRRD